MIKQSDEFFKHECLIFEQLKIYVKLSTFYSQRVSFFSMKRKKKEKNREEKRKNIRMYFENVK